jgi:hypothetical protein
MVACSLATVVGLASGRAHHAHVLLQTLHKGRNAHATTQNNKTNEHKDEATMLKEVHDVLLEYYQIWYSAFMYFAAGGSGDPYHMSLNSFTTYLVSAFQPLGRN